jgi:glycosyltransferase involved in cell wall biosynthesis
MRILVIAKRQYTGKDLVTDRYGRLFELPERLQAAGHDVRGIALSYRRMGASESRSEAGVRWSSRDVMPVGLLRYDAVFADTTRSWSPDVVWASSDALHAMLARWLSQRYAIPYVVDLYDNYESFALTRLPGLRQGLRVACRDAAAITVVTPSLREKVEREYHPRGTVVVLGNGVNRSVFHPREKYAARRRMRLPDAGRIVGTAGSITYHRGIEDMFLAFNQLASQDDNVWLAYAGPRDGTPSRYPHPRSLDLGVLDQQAVPEMLSALDVAIVCNRDSDFGRYCFPMKLEEALACGTPVVATRVGDVASRLAFDPESLYEAGAHEELASKLATRLSASPTVMPSPMDWDELAGRLELALELAIRTGRV